MANVPDVIGPSISDDARSDIESGRPYRVDLRLRGTCPILFCRWSNEAVAAKAKAAKGSVTKRTDNVESYVWRCEDGTIGIPGEYLRQSALEAARYRQDPRSPRKSARDLVKAGLVSETVIASLGKSTWDFLDQRRVVVQRSSVTRSRPAFLAGWETDFALVVNLPEYIGPEFIYELIADAGRLVGIGDFRPTYGRFMIVRFAVNSLT